MISIIIPVYNQAKKLANTLESISKQTLTDWELIVVDDGSHDDPEKVFTDFVSKTKSENNFIFLHQENKGAPAARNHGWHKSQGDFLFFCDADAILQSNALELLLDALQQNAESSYVYPSFYWGRKLFKVGSFNPNKLKQEPYIHTMALIRSMDFPENGWDESIKKFQDWDLWLTMLEFNKTGIWLDQILFKIIPGGTISSWLPAFVYKLMPFLPVVKKYQAAKKVIMQKHGLL
ncbi:glycosyltransferase family 2 protein [Patescibacteria group bacterium]|nr:glycosyltransferase family 2 protein [Patescibacteria group bacterium]